MSDQLLSSINVGESELRPDETPATSQPIKDTATTNSTHVGTTDLLDEITSEAITENCTSLVANDRIPDDDTDVQMLDYEDDKKEIADECDASLEQMVEQIANNDFENIDNEVPSAHDEVILHSSPDDDMSDAPQPDKTTPIATEVTDAFTTNIEETIAAGSRSDDGTTLVSDAQVSSDDTDIQMEENHDRKRNESEVNLKQSVEPVANNDLVNTDNEISSSAHDEVTLVSNPSDDKSDAPQPDKTTPAAIEVTDACTTDIDETIAAGSRSDDGTTLVSDAQVSSDDTDIQVVENHDGKRDECDGSMEYIVETILDKKTDSDGTIKYLVKWEGYQSSENTWEPYENLADCEKAMRNFEIMRAQKLAKKHGNNNNNDSSNGGGTVSGSGRTKSSGHKEFRVEDIRGLTEVENERYFLVSLQNSSEKVFIRNSTARRMFPIKVIDFYEKHIQWKQKSSSS